jgi:glutathione S-transferase
MGKSTRNPKNQYITKTQCSWWVRFTHKVRGKQVPMPFCHTFAFSHYGGEQPALEAAREYRDRIKETLDICDARQHSTKKRRKKAFSNTGIVGVFHSDYYRKSGRHVTEFQVLWRVNKKTKTKRFTYNPEEYQAKERAFKQAVKHRKAMEKLYYDD